MSAACSVVLMTSPHGLVVVGVGWLLTFMLARRLMISYLMTEECPQAWYPSEERLRAGDTAATQSWLSNALPRNSNSQ